MGELWIQQILRLVNIPEDVFPYALLYIRIYLLGMPVIFLYNFEAAIFRSTGDTKTPHRLENPGTDYPNRYACGGMKFDPDTAQS